MDHKQLIAVRAFNSMPNLQIVYLNHNNLTEVPHFNLPSSSLIALYLQRNPINQIPDNLCGRNDPDIHISI